MPIALLEWRQNQNTPNALDNNQSGRIGLQVGVALSKRPQYLDLARFHRMRGRRSIVLMTVRMQGGMHQQMSQMVTRRDAPGSCFPAQHRYANDDIGMNDRVRCVCKRQNVGRVVLAAKIAVQATTLAPIDKSDSHVRFRGQRGRNPTRKG